MNQSCNHGILILIVIGFYWIFIYSVITALSIFILRLGIESDFKVDCRLSHRRNVNLVVVVFVAEDADASNDDTPCVKTGIDIIFPVALS